MIYIQEQIGFWDIDSLPDSYLIGTTIEDYDNGAYLLLSDEQSAFHTAHPDATPMEVWRMELTPLPERPMPEPLPEPDPLDLAKKEKIIQIDMYDYSGTINSFMVNGVSAWLMPEVRANYKNSIESAELLGETEITFIIANIPATSTLMDARLMLAKIQRYADRCTLVTETHKANVNALTNTEEVEAYDYTTGYPVKESFTLTNMVQNADDLNQNKEEEQTV